MPPEATVAAVTDQVPAGTVAGAADDTTPAGTGETVQTGAAADQSAVNEEDNDAIELLGQAEFDKVKGDPRALAKSLNRAFTQKSQANAAALSFVKDLETRPVEVIKALAQRAGIDLGAANTAPKKNEAFEALSDAFGPEVAADIYPAFGKVVEQMVEARLGPIRQAQDVVAAEAAEARSNAVMDSFGAKHADWKTHEKAMMEIAKRVQPAPGTTELQHLEDLYYLATRDVDETNRVKGVVDRMGKAVKATDVGPVPAGRVDPTAARPNSIKEAFDLAKRGVRVQ